MLWCRVLYFTPEYYAVIIAIKLVHELISNSELAIDVDIVSLSVLEHLLIMP